MTSKNPPLKWTNADDGKTLIVTVDVPDLSVEEVNFDTNVFRLKATDSSRNLYDVALQLFGDVLGDQMRKSPGQQKLQIRVPKVDANEWPRLTAERAKCAWITADFANYSPLESRDEPLPDPLLDCAIQAPYKSFRQMLHPEYDEEVEESRRIAEESKRRVMKMMRDAKRKKKSDESA